MEIKRISVRSKVCIQRAQHSLVFQQLINKLLRPILRTIRRSKIGGVWKNVAWAYREFRQNNWELTPPPPPLRPTLLTLCGPFAVRKCAIDARGAKTICAHNLLPAGRLADCVDRQPIGQCLWICQKQPIGLHKSSTKLCVPSPHAQFSCTFPNSLPRSLQKRLFLILTFGLQLESNIIKIHGLSGFDDEASK